MGGRGAREGRAKTLRALEAPEGSWMIGKAQWEAWWGPFNRVTWQNLTLYIASGPRAALSSVWRILCTGEDRVDEGRRLQREATGALTGWTGWSGDDEFSACLVVKVRGSVDGLNVEVRQREEPRDVSLRVRLHYSYESQPPGNSYVHSCTYSTI